MTPLRLSETEAKALADQLEFDRWIEAEFGAENGPENGAENGPKEGLETGQKEGLFFTPSDRVRIDPDLTMAEVERSLPALCSCLGCRELAVSWASILLGANRQQQMDAVYVATFKGVSVHGDDSKGEPTQFWVEEDPRGMPHFCDLLQALDARVAWGIVNPGHPWRLWSSGWSEGKGAARG